MMDRHIKNISLYKARSLTYVIALLFIPAFIYGVASIWTVIFSVVLAVFFRRRLMGIIQGYADFESCIDKWKYARKNIWLLILECILVTAVPAVLCFLMVSDSGTASGIDGILYRKFAEFLYEADEFIALTSGQKIILVNVMNIPFLSLCFMAFGCRKLREIFGVMYEKAKDPEWFNNPKKMFRTFNFYQITFEFGWFAAAWAFMSPVLFDELFLNQDIVPFKDIAVWGGLAGLFPCLSAMGWSIGNAGVDWRKFVLMSNEKDSSGMEKREIRSVKK